MKYGIIKMQKEEHPFRNGKLNEYMDIIPLNLKRK